VCVGGGGGVLPTAYSTNSVYDSHDAPTQVAFVSHAGLIYQAYSFGNIRAEGHNKMVPDIEFRVGSKRATRCTGR